MPSSLDELLDQDSECRDGGTYRRALGYRQLREGGSEAPLMRLLPVEQLLATGLRQSDDGNPPVSGSWLSRRGTGLDELLHEAAGGGRGEMQRGADLPDSDAGRLVISQALQQFYLRHGQRLPWIVGTDAGAQNPTQAIDDIGQRLGVRGFGRLLCGCGHVSMLVQYAVSRNVR